MNRICNPRFWIATAFTIALSVHSLFAATRGRTSNQVKCDAGQFLYLLLIPSKTTPEKPLPALLLLHGAGDQPDSFIETWTHMAGKRRIILMAPALPVNTTFPDIAPSVFRCIVHDAEQKAAIDPRRVYVFGHSMGGDLTLRAAMLDSDLFAAAALHASYFDDDEMWMLTRPARKMPIAIYSGDRDERVHIDKVREMRDRLVKAGFPVHFMEIEGHDHNYYAVAGDVNEGAWKFLTHYQLPAQ
jgi:predicted esterase